MHMYVYVCIGVRMGVDVMILPRLAAEENPAAMKQKVGKYLFVRFIDMK